MRVEEARYRLERAQLETTTRRQRGEMGREAHGSRKIAKGVKSAKGKDSIVQVQKEQNRESRLQHAKLNLEIANELTINDYFVLYLIQSDNDGRILEAVKKMTPEEMAELMHAYKKHLEGSRSTSRDASFLGS